MIKLERKEGEKFVPSGLWSDEKTAWDNIPKEKHHLYRTTDTQGKVLTDKTEKPKAAKKEKPEVE